MTIRRATVGLCMLCALLVSAFAAQGAAAATKGTTAFTCKEVAVNTGHFNGAHCKAADAGSGAGYNWDHVAVAENTTTTFKATNEKVGATTSETIPATLKSTVAGSAIELSSKVVHAIGGLENKKETEGNVGEHYIHAHELTISYTEVSEKKAGCEVVGLPGGVGKIETKPLTMTSTKQEDSLKFTPVAPATVFAEFELKNCVPKGTYKVVGSVTCKPDGATITCDHEEITKSGTLHLGSAAGPVAGYAGVTTTVAGDKPLGEETVTPLSVTTVETP